MNIHKCTLVMKNSVSILSANPLIPHGNRLNKLLTRLYFFESRDWNAPIFRRFRLSCTPNDPTAPNFLTHFQAVEDPRQVKKVIYPLDEVHFWFCAVRYQALTVGHPSHFIGSIHAQCQVLR